MISPRSRDCGLTLVELVVTVALVGLVAGALAGAITFFVRNQSAAGNRIDETRGLQQLVNYFPADVGSAQRIEFGPPWTSPCLGIGTPILNLYWVEAYPGSPSEAASATYSLHPDGATLVRGVCGTTSSTVTVARGLTSADAVFRDATSSKVDLTLDFGDDATVMTASSRNCESPDEC